MSVSGKAAKAAFFAVLTALLLSTAALAAEGDLAVAVGVTTGSSLRLRTEPSTNSGIVTMLDKDVTAAVLETLDGWYRVDVNGSQGYVSADYLALDEDNEFETCGRVTGSGVNVRDIPSTDGGVVATLSEHSTLDVIGLTDGWYRVSLDGAEGYIRSDFLTLTRSSGISGDFSDVIGYAQQFLGTPYRYGGASPSGFDCSGFTMYVYQQFGVSLPHTATGQWQSGIGTRVYSSGELQSGDLVFFNDPSQSNGRACSHAGLYIGGGQFIHSSSSRSGGVIVSDLSSGYYNRYFVGGIHL